MGARGHGIKLRSKDKTRREGRHPLFIKGIPFYADALESRGREQSTRRDFRRGGGDAAAVRAWLIDENFYTYFYYVNGSLIDNVAVSFVNVRSPKWNKWAGTTWTYNANIYMVSAQNKNF